MWLWSWTDVLGTTYVADMNANAKLLARRRAREAQRRANEERYRRDRANADVVATIRMMLHRVGAIDKWERKRLDQAAEHVRADATKKRASYFAGLQAAVDQMRDRGQTLALIATLVEVDVREIQAALRRARTGDNLGRGLVGPPGAGSRTIRSRTQDARTDSGTRTTDTALQRSNGDDGASSYDSARCIRCDAMMFDADDAPRRGRRRLYCSDTCRRDASAARTAAERHGSPIRVVEVPRAGSCVEQTVEKKIVPQAPAAVTPLDAADITLHNDQALRALLARLTEQARLKKLDRETLTAARELAKAVHPHRSW
jgi:hypothetical protein